MLRGSSSGVEAMAVEVAAGQCSGAVEQSRGLNLHYGRIDFSKGFSLIEGRTISFQKSGRYGRLVPGTAGQTGVTRDVSRRDHPRSPHVSKTGTCTASRGHAHRPLVLIVSFFPALNAWAHGLHVGGGHSLWRAFNPSLRPPSHPCSAGTQSHVSLVRLPPAVELNSNHRKLFYMLHGCPPFLIPTHMCPQHTRKT